MGSFDFEAALKADTIDPLVRDIVVDINASGWLWTAESCQGHPDDTTGNAWAVNTSPMLRLACQAEHVGRMFQALYEASTQMRDADGLEETFVWKAHPEERRGGWAEILLFVEARTAYEHDRAVAMLAKFAEGL
jgi:hypothetical protein